MVLQCGTRFKVTPNDYILYIYEVVGQTLYHLVDI